MNIILLGAPGSGKGTQSELLVEKMDLIQLSTGDLFRNNISNETELGLEAKRYMNEGNLVPDSVTNAMVNMFLKEQNNSLIFDGYPRTNDQAEELDKMLLNLNSEITKVIYINVDEELLMERLTGRMICPECKRSYHKVNRKPKVEWVCDFDSNELIVRADDMEDKIQVRLSAFKSQTQPLIDFYKNQNKLVEINASKLSVEELFEKIKGSLI